MPTGLSLHVTRYDSGMRQAPHAHGELHLSIVLRGTVSESIAGRTGFLHPMSLVSKDPGVVHANAWGGQGALLARLSIADRGLADLADGGRPVLPWRWAHDLAAAAPFLRLVGRARAADSPVAPGDVDVVDLVAALTPTARVADQESGDPPAWLRDAVALMRDGWTPGLTVGAVARHAGVHPVYLARCMRRWYRTSVGVELRRSRLRLAARSLATIRETVSGVAHGAGFSDEPHLCRSLRAATALTPGRLRLVLRHAESIARPVGR